MSRLSRLLAAIGGGILVATALYHGLGYPQFSSGLMSSSLESSLARALASLWLFFSWHLFVVGVPPVWASARAAAQARPVLVFCGVVALGDFVWVLAVAGFFLGTALLFLAALCLLASAALWHQFR